MFKKIRKNALYNITMPEFSAGVNYKDGDTLIDDNQLSDVNNLLFDKASLKTRPGMYFENGGIYSTFGLWGSEEMPDDISCKTIVTDVYRVVNGVRKRLIITYSTEITRKTAKLVFYGEDGTVDVLPNFPFNNAPLYSCFAFMNGDNLFVYTNYGELIDPLLTYGYPPTAYKFDFDLLTWTILYKEDFYVPTVFINGKAQSINSEQRYSICGDLVEGYNLLNNNYKVTFTGYSPEGKSIFVLPSSVTAQERHLGEKVIIKHTTQNGTVSTHIMNLTAPESQYYIGGVAMNCRLEASTQPDGYACILFSGDNNGNLARFAFVSNDGIETLTEDEGMLNNIEVTVMAHDPKKGIQNSGQHITNCTFCGWYGGNASGIKGGTRLFVSGDSRNKNRIIWSDLNNPLYFPENNYAYVGNDDQAVTAFAKQGEMLVVFKEREMYYTYYCAGSSISGEEIQSGEIVDVTAGSAVFPIIQIHSEVGCDCPESIALCDNKLVWCSDKKIYLLANNNQFSERNVISIGGCIEKKLNQIMDADIKNCYGIDQNGKYYLCCCRNVIVMDYKNNAISYASSYYGGGTTDKRLAFYCWELPETIHAAFGVGNRIAVVVSDQMEDSNELVKIRYNKIYSLKDDYGQDDVITPLFSYNKETLYYKNFITVSAVDCAKSYEQIKIMLKTKKFDFKRPNRMKKICAVYLGINNFASSIDISFNTDKNDECNQKNICGVKFAGQTGMMRIVPEIQHISFFGMQIESKGLFRLNSLSVNYKIFGSVM